MTDSTPAAAAHLRDSYPDLNHVIADRLLWVALDAEIAKMNESTTAAHRIEELADLVYRLHGCSCEEHSSNGVTRSCQEWRRNRARAVAEAVLDGT